MIEGGARECGRQRPARRRPARQLPGSYLLPAAAFLASATSRAT